MIPAPVALLLIIIAAAVPGALIVQAWSARFRTDPLSFIFAANTLGVLLLGWGAFVLAELGCFSMLTWLGFWLASTTVLLLVWLRRRQTSAIARSCPSEWRRREAVVLAAWLVIASVFYFRPHEFVAGGADAGVYVNLGANIARSGAILIHDPLLGQLDPVIRPVLLRPMPEGEAAPFYLLPGFYVTGDPPDLITPQFFHLHPVWQAIGYATGGLGAELLITPLWGILGCLAVYFTVRSLWGWKPAFLTLVALSATALQVWFGRYPTAEVLTQYLFWTGMWALVNWLDRREPPGLWALLAGVAIGQVFLTRVDTYVLLALPLVLALWFSATRSWRRDAFWFFAPLLMLAVHSLLHGFLITRPYFSLITGVGVGSVIRVAAPLTCAALAIVGFAVVWLRRKESRGKTARERIASLIPIVLRIVAIAIVLAALFAYFVRPHLGNVRLNNYWYGGGKIPNLDQDNLVRLGWYLSPLGLALGVGGFAWMTARDANRRTAFLLLAGGFFAFMFLWRIGANPHQVYAMRRYVPQVLPLFAIGGAYLLWCGWRKAGTVGRGLIAWLTLVWIAGIVVYGRPFVTHVDYTGVAAQISALGSSLPEKSVVLFADASAVGVGDFVGTPLRFLENKNVFVVREPQRIDPTLFADTIRGWQEQGYAVYWAEPESGAALPHGPLRLGPRQAYAIQGEMLEGAYDHKPSAILPVVWRFTLSEILPIAGPEARGTT